MTARHFPIAASVFLAACQSGTGPEAVQAFDGIGDGETVYFAGNEPFWGGQASGDSLTYTTPENIDGTTIPVTRFTGNSGIGLSGTLDGQSFDMTVTRGACNDTMSDAEYPFTVTLRIGDEQRNGCAWTDAKPRTNTEAL